MLDHAQKWPPVPDWQTATIDRPGLSIRSLSGSTHHLVSGNLAVALRKLGLTETLGAWAIAKGLTYSVGMAFDRMLVVGTGLSPLEEVWHDGGYAITDISAGTHVFEICGDRLNDLIARGTSINLADAGPSAALLFAGMNVLLYRHEREDLARLHVNRALAPALWTWFAAQALHDVKSDRF